MDSVTALISVAIAAWVGQIALGWLQINHFNQALSALADKGHVRLGRSQGRFKPRVVLAIGTNDEGRIIDNFVMQGLTVFSRPRNESRLNGRVLSEICPEEMFPANQALQQALKLAIANKR